MSIRTYLAAAALAAGAALAVPASAAHATDNTDTGTAVSASTSAPTDVCGAVPSDYLGLFNLGRTYTGTLKDGSSSYTANLTFNAIGAEAAQLGYVAEVTDGLVPSSFREVRRGIAALSSDNNGIGTIDFDFPTLQTVSITPVCASGSPAVKSILIKAQDTDDKSVFKGTLK
ncbi:hypothetical protein [Streptomyces sp. TBY4]|uniref:hypothetical protein n=1 Tax=Streptomyces sp. TBY4 TaxID=2962030 RepID=UPI0020B8AB19|nr:hypothetical protein [Streptomyces sp. TBY4]MCP3759374.1 hypothetical protein [Streptomyces sp. TBY4]